MNRCILPTIHCVHMLHGIYKMAEGKQYKFKLKRRPLRTQTTNMLHCLPPFKINLRKPERPLLIKKF
ncbi:unnamed protein product [Boreogadus saida]